MTAPQTWTLRTVIPDGLALARGEIRMTSLDIPGHYLRDFRNAHFWECFPSDLESLRERTRSQPGVLVSLPWPADDPVSVRQAEQIRALGEWLGDALPSPPEGFEWLDQGLLPSGRRCFRLWPESEERPDPVREAGEL